MKIELKFVKNALKYTSIAIGILIMFIQFYYITSEITKTEMNIEFIKESKIPKKTEYCENPGIKLTDLIFKSIMAFIAGCLFSEKKYIRMGII